MAQQEQSDNIDELIKAASQPGDVPLEDHVSQFILGYNIGPGPNRVTMSHLWSWYLEWVGTKKRIEYRHFVAEFIFKYKALKPYEPLVYSKKRCFYMVNRKPDSDNIQDVYKNIRECHAQRKKKKKPSL